MSRHGFHRDLSAPLSLRTLNTKDSIAQSCTSRGLATFALVCVYETYREGRRYMLLPMW